MFYLVVSLSLYLGMAKMQTLGERLLMARKAKKMTQQDLASFSRF